MLPFPLAYDFRQSEKTASGKKSFIHAQLGSLIDHKWNVNAC